MSFTNSPNMGFPVPTVLNEPGPQYAQDVNQALLNIDSHNHSPGQGVPIGSQSININADLPFNVNNAISIRTVRFVSTTATSGTDLSCVYVKGVDLFYNDSSGNVVRITQSGGLASTGIFNGNISTTAIISATGPNPASSGFIRMNNNTDFVSWRNAANNADDRIYFDNSDNLQVVGGPNTYVNANNFRAPTYQIIDGSNSTLSLKTAQSTSAYTLALPPNPSTATVPLLMDSTGKVTAGYLPPTFQTFASTGVASYFTPAGVKYIKVRMVGGGGGGLGSSGSPPATSGTNTTFGATAGGPLLACSGGGPGGLSGNGGFGGLASIAGGYLGIALQGGGGQASASILNTPGGYGGSSPFFGGGGVGNNFNVVSSRVNGVQNTGGGGAGGGGNGNVNAAAGGGSGGFIEVTLTNVSSSYAVVVGNGGVGYNYGPGIIATAGNGGSGYVFVEEFYY